MSPSDFIPVEIEGEVVVRTNENGIARSLFTDEPTFKAIDTCSGLGCKENNTNQVHLYCS
eukprot:m.26711 g.26711  ORF g.26711 m.26711 type:complete len:60 (+) comp29480_c0_seq1:753-932(+)